MRILALALSSCICMAQIVEESLAFDPGPFDLIRGEGTDQFILQALAADALVGLSPGGAVVPRLAERWEIRGTEIRFFLRKNARFGDGTPLTAADVTWTLRRIQEDPQASASKKGLLEGLKVRVGPGWVAVRGDRPAARLLAELTQVPIARRDRPGEGGGPYALRREGDVWHLTARSHFLAPTIPGFRFRLIRDPQTVLNDLRKGWLTLGVPPVRPGLQPPPSHREVHQPAHAQVMVWSRMGSEPLKALERWRAEALPEAFLAPRARASRGLLPESLGFPPVAMAGPPFRPAGQRWEILYGAGEEVVEKALLALRARAARDGVILEPRPLENTLLTGRLLRGDFTLICGLEIYAPHPWGVLELMEPGSPLNICGWTHPDFKAVHARLTATGGKAWEDLQRIWAEAPPCLPLVDLQSVVWVDRRLKVEPGPLGIYRSTPGAAGWRWTAGR